MYIRNQLVKKRPINSFLYANVLSGTKRFNTTTLIDEYGELFSFPEFAKKIGVKEIRPVTGFLFPESVLMTRDFKLMTNSG